MKALVVGGSNGIGLAICIELIKRGYKIVIADKNKPSDNEIDNNSYTYYETNLLDFDEDLFKNISKDNDINLLMITAGIGRVADFEFLHLGEINNTLTINTLSTIKILRIFYDRIKSKLPFYTGVMVSIAGLVCSPMFSVYSASKAADFRFIESINIELEVSGSNNRILNVSPGSIQGTKFNGAITNNTKLTSNLAIEIVDNLLNNKELFIPEYDSVFYKVISDYKEDPHAYGLHSYEYKKYSGRAINKNKAQIGYLSGTFDLFHVGHLNLLYRAKQKCDYLIVGVHNSGSWKGKETFIPLEERKKIVSCCRYVDKVVDSCREDSDAWELYHYTRLFVGSDYKNSERFNRYEEYFKDKNVEIVYFPYTKSTSSTQIRNMILSKG